MLAAAVPSYLGWRWHCTQEPDHRAASSEAPASANRCQNILLVSGVLLTVPCCFPRTEQHFFPAIDDVGVFKKSVEFAKCRKDAQSLDFGECRPSCNSEQPGRGPTVKTLQHVSTIRYYYYPIFGDREISDCIEGKTA